MHGWVGGCVGGCLGGLVGGGITDNKLDMQQIPMRDDETIAWFHLLVIFCCCLGRSSVVICTAKPPGCDKSCVSGDRAKRNVCIHSVRKES